MNKSQLIIDRMKNLGLTEYEAKAYYVLLNHDYMIASEIAQLANIPRTSIYQTMKSLIHKNFCTTVPGKVLQYKAMKPDYGFNKLADDWVYALKAQQDEARNLSNLLLNMFQERDSYKHPLDYIEVIRDKIQFRDKVHEFGMLAESEILSLSKPPYMIDVSHQIERRGMDFKPSIKYRYVIEITPKEPDYVLDYYRHMQELGAEVRVATELPIKLLIFDRKVTILSLKDEFVEEPSNTSLVIENKYLAAFYCQAFDTYFQNAIAVDDFIKNRK